MRFKVVMDSGKEYIVHSDLHYEDFVKSLFTETKNNLGYSSKTMKNTFLFIDNKEKILFNPVHISSIELLN